MNKLINYNEAVYRTAPATPGLLKKYLYLFKKDQQLSEMQQDQPFLGLPLLTIPSDKPTTKQDLLRALYGYFDGNLRSFTVPKLSCSRRNSDQ